MKFRNTINLIVFMSPEIFNEMNEQFLRKQSIEKPKSQKLTLKSHEMNDYGTKITRSKEKVV